MRIFGLLSWYDEREDWLRELVASTVGLVDVFLAVDGAYAMYPDAAARSDPGQFRAITEAASSHALDHSIYVPKTAWAGNEVEKRAFMFEYGRQCGAVADDWFLILDGDMLAGDRNVDIIRGRLSTTCHDVATVNFWHKDEGTRPESFRSLFRALPTLTVEGMHYCYTALRPDGSRRYMWHPPFHSGTAVEPAEDLTQQLILIHRRTPRERPRFDAAAKYYADRDSAGIERGVLPE